MNEYLEMLIQRTTVLVVGSYDNTGQTDWRYRGNRA